MSIHPTPSGGSNAEVAAGLRELAAFLERHPELPAARFACVSLRAARDGQPARETLELAASVLGARATEERLFAGDVSITAKFGPVALRASASIAELADTPPDQIPYQPIIKGEYSVRRDLVRRAA